MADHISSFLIELPKIDVISELLLVRPFTDSWLAIPVVVVEMSLQEF